ncbi:MAG: ABC transporter ATP-binding protein [bacterium]|nr:ABC transporter ATP-binding protein [bacterium]
METHNDEKRNSLLYLFSKTWRYSEGNRNKVVWYWIMFIVANSIHMFASPLIMAKVINIIQKEGVTTKNFKVLLGLLMLTLLITLVFWSLHGPARCIERGNAFHARLNYWRFLLRGVMTLPMEWHAGHHSGDTIDKSQKGTSSLFTFAEDSFMVIWGTVQLTASLMMLFVFGNVSVVLIVLMMIFISIWITVHFDRQLLPQYTALNRMENEISASVFDAISNIATVITLRVEKLVFSAIMHKMEKPFELFKYNQRLSEFKWFLNGVCVTIMTILVLVVYFWQNIDTAQGVLVGSVYILINYLEKISELFYTFTRMYGDIVRQKSRVINSEELARDFKTENFTNHVLPESWQRLEIGGLNFSYHNDNDGALHLENISASFERGKRYAIVGASGGGKSTLLKIMRDLYHPRSGILRVDGERVHDGFAGISRAIALVPQNPEIFATTIWENITLGTEYDLEFVKHFTDMACFTDVVEGLPKKFESSIKEKGVNLSGGQQQRLALARGLLACHDKDVVLLDEPTSSLDTATEMRVYRNIFREFRDKTIVSSVHRLHLLPLFHEIYIFSGGRIIASGTLENLLTDCPEFQELWQEYHEHREEV